MALKAIPLRGSDCLPPALHTVSSKANKARSSFIPAFSDPRLREMNGKGFHHLLQHGSALLR